MNPLLAYYHPANPIVVVLVILFVVALLTPAWPYSRGWGYSPLGLLLIVVLVLFLFGCSSLPPEATAPPTPDETRALTSLAVGDYLQLGVQEKDRAQAAALINQAATVFLSLSGSKLPAPDALQAALQSNLPANKNKALIITNVVGIYRLRYTALSKIDLNVPQSAYATAVANGLKDATLLNTTP